MVPDREKIARLQAALDTYEPGTGLFDREHEEALARRGFNQGMALRIGREALDERIAGREE